MVGADDPNGAVRFQHAARRQQPGAGEGVVDLKTRELIPVIVDGIDLGLVGPVQIAIELQIVGRIGKDHVDGLFGQPVERGDAIALQDRIQPFGLLGSMGKVVEKTHGRHCDTQSTRYCLLPVMVTDQRKYSMKVEGSDHR